MSERIPFQLEELESVEGILERRSELEKNIYDFTRLLKEIYKKHAMNQKETDLIWSNSNLLRDPDYPLYRQRFTDARLVFSEVHKSGLEPVLVIGRKPVTYFKKERLHGESHYVYVEDQLLPGTSVSVTEIAEHLWQIDWHKGCLPVLSAGEAIYYGGRLDTIPKTDTDKPE